MCNLTLTNRLIYFLYLNKSKFDLIEINKDHVFLWINVNWLTAPWKVRYLFQFNQVLSNLNLESVELVLVQ